MKKIIAGLNPPQREAVLAVEGPVLVLAGAGTGKTRVITCRIAHMLDTGIAPENILGMTFTNKAAREMRERVAKMVAAEVAAKVALGTFHSFCARALRSHIHLAGDFTGNFTIIGEGDRTGVLRQAMAEAGIAAEDGDGDNLPLMGSLIGRAKNKLESPEECRANAAGSLMARVAAVYERYQRILENQNMVDFDDLLLLLPEIWRRAPEVLEEYRGRYRYILVDEYQDTNLAQSRLLDMLAGERRNLCVVGDDDQSIYSWRGAVVENILNFPQHYPGAKVVKLEQNYRSTNNILKAANGLIGSGKSRYDKNLWADDEDGELIDVVEAEDQDTEGKFVVELARNFVDTNPAYSYRDIAVLYRSNHLSRTLEQWFRRGGVPYQVVGGNSFFERKEILDAIAYLKLLLNPRDDQSLLRILGTPPRGVGDKAVTRLKQLRAATAIPMTELIGDPHYHKDLSANATTQLTSLFDAINTHRRIFEEPGGLAVKIRHYLDDVGYLGSLMKIYKKREDAEKRAENLGEFISAAAMFERDLGRDTSLMEFIESVSLLDGNDRAEGEDGGDAVSLMTVHAAKGLEFALVVVVATEQKTFPHQRALDEGNKDEERRLFYVAMTRARKRLVITRARTRFRFGHFETCRPSEFLRAIPEHFLAVCSDDAYFAPSAEQDVDNAFAKIFSSFGQNA